MSAAPKFDWQSDDSIVAEHQPALAVYRNARGQTVLRTERAWDQDEDTFILINQENVVSVVYALIDTTDRALQIVEITDRGFCDVDRPEVPERAQGSDTLLQPKDSKAAERARRYREKKRRDANRDAGVTHRDATVTDGVTPLIAAE